MQSLASIKSSSQLKNNSWPKCLGAKTTLLKASALNLAMTLQLLSNSAQIPGSLER
jgi:hypothetical protein